MPVYLLRIAPFFVVLAVILFSGLKPEPVPQVFDQQDKLHHLLGFAALMFTLRLAFPQWRVIWAISLSLAAAVMIELAQSLIPNRWASMGDMLANTLGVLLGWACSHLAYQWYLRRIGVVSDDDVQEQAEPLPDAGRH